MFRRKLIGLGAVVAVTGLALSGCAPANGGADEGEVSIEILSNFTSDIPRGQTLGALVDEFNDANDGVYNVKLVEQPDWPALQLQIRSMISAGSAPDVFMYNHNPTDFSREESGVLMDWKPFLDADPEWRERFPESVLETLTVDGGIYGIPGDQGPALLYYNTDVLERSGIDAPPTTWDQFFDDADALKADGVAAIGLMTADDAWHAMNAFSYLAVQLGGLDVFAPGASLDTPEIEKAAEYTKRLFEYTTADAVGANYPIASRNFISKQSAMIVDGTYLNNAISSDLEEPCLVGVAPMPNFDEGPQTPADFLITDSLNGWGAAKQSDPAKEEAVVAWMKFFTSNESAVRMAVDGQYLMTAKIEPTEDDLARASCQMAQVIDIANQSSANAVVMTRAITPSGQAAIPALLEALVLGSITPSEFASQLDAANSTGQ